MLASTELFIESVIDSLILSDKMGMILPRTSGLVSASITCTVIVFFFTGVFLVLTDALRSFSPTDVLRILACHVCCFEVAGRSSGFSGAGLLLGIKVLMDEHIPLKQTLKEQQKRIDEQKEMISKQAHLVVQRIQEQHLKSSLKGKKRK